MIQLTERRQRHLHLCESLPLGDRRFVAVIEFEKARFLVGGTSGSLSLLSRLDSQGSAGMVPSAGETPAEPREEQL